MHYLLFSKISKLLIRTGTYVSINQQFPYIVFPPIHMVSNETTTGVDSEGKHGLLENPSLAFEYLRDSGLNENDLETNIHAMFDEDE